MTPDEGKALLAWDKKLREVEEYVKGLEAERTRLVSKLAAVEVIHRGEVLNRGGLHELMLCRADSFPWPCPTLRALEDK